MLDIEKEVKELDRKTLEELCIDMLKISMKEIEKDERRKFFETMLNKEYRRNLLKMIGL